MAPLPANNTGRVFFDYVTGTATTSREHTTAIRYNALSITTLGVQIAFFDVLSAFGATNFRVGWKVIRARWQGAGTNVTLPLTLDSTLGAFEGTGSNPPYNPRYETVEDTFQGRSPLTGRRVDFSLYRAMDDSDGSFRVEAGGSGFPLVVAAAVAVLNGYPEQGTFVTIDGTDGALWYPYMNRNYNSYWERRSRLG